MTLDELVSKIIVRMGNMPDLRAQIEDEAEYVKEYLMEKDTELRPFFLETTESLAYTAGVNYVSIPTGYIVHDEGGVMWNASAGMWLTQRDYPAAVQHFTDEEGVAQTATYPTSFALKGNRIYLFPTPDVSGSLDFSFYKASETLRNSPEDNPWLVYAGDWLLNATGGQVAQNNQHVEAASIFEQRAKLARQRVVGMIEERRLTGLNYDS